MRITIIVCLVALARPAGAGGLDELYDRVATDLKAGRPLVATVHVALCDNRIIHCGTRVLGDGDRPARNLYWGGAAGFRAYFDHARGWRRVHLDRGDGELILERAVYRRRVRRPPAALRRRGVTGGFEILLVGLGYRGRRIADATTRFLRHVARDRGPALKLADGRTIHIGGRGHVVGYAGHNHLMDARGFAFPRVRRRTAVGYFALACMSAPYMAEKLCGPRTRALLLTRSLMYPGAFTIDGLLRGLAAGGSQQRVFRRGCALYARYQKRPQGAIRRAFIHDGQARFRRAFRRCR